MTLKVGDERLVNVLLGVGMMEMFANGVFHVFSRHVNAEILWKRREKSEKR